jgi:hypothetical protein
MGASEKLHKIEVKEYDQLVQTVKPKPAVLKTASGHLWWEEPSACWGKLSPTMP